MPLIDNIFPGGIGSAFSRICEVGRIRDVDLQLVPPGLYAGQIQPTIRFNRR